MAMVEFLDGYRYSERGGMAAFSAWKSVRAVDWHTYYGWVGGRCTVAQLNSLREGKRSGEDVSDDA